MAVQALFQKPQFESGSVDILNQGLLGPIDLDIRMDRWKGYWGLGVTLETICSVHVSLSDKLDILAVNIPLLITRKKSWYPHEGQEMHVVQNEFHVEMEMKVDETFSAREVSRPFEASDFTHEDERPNYAQVLAWGNVHEHGDIKDPVPVNFPSVSLFVIFEYEYLNI